MWVDGEGAQGRGQGRGREGVGAGRIDPQRWGRGWVYLEFSEIQRMYVRMADSLVYRPHFWEVSWRLGGLSARVGVLCPRFKCDLCK